MEIDLVLYNGQVHTLDPAEPKCSAIAISGNEIVGTGTDSLAMALSNDQGRKIDLNGRCVIPGLVDTHLHFESYALSLQRVDLTDVPDLDTALATIKEEADKNDNDGWIQGRGWNQALWPGGHFPAANDLDQIVPNRPILLNHRSGHAAWANTKAMQIAKLNEVNVDPQGGAIQRDDLGRPTGILFEKAMKLISDCVPKPSVTEVSDAMGEAQKRCLRAGLTGFHDFDGRRCFLALQELRNNSALQLRVVKNIPVERLHHALGVGINSGFGDDWIRIGSVKLYADGALGPRTASMIASYEGEKDNLGLIVTDKEEMIALVRDASQHGLSVAVHAIGDKANHDVLDVFEEVARENLAKNFDQRFPSPPLRHRIEHAQLLHPEDISRFASIGVIASMQPIHATADMEMVELHWGDRSRYAYAWRSIIDSGATFAFGSDAPVEAIEPLTGIHAAVTRQRVDGAPGAEGWIPEQRITIQEAVAGYTIGAAIASNRMDYMGTISKGNLADLTILERDIFGIHPNEIPSVGVAGTIVDGQVKYRNW
ncbi:MAG: amidohydrolase [Candidatus Promineifilaceae bacterium]